MHQLDRSLTFLHAISQLVYKQKPNSQGCKQHCFYLFIYFYLITINKKKFIKSCRWLVVVIGHLFDRVEAFSCSELKLAGITHRPR